MTDPDVRNQLCQLVEAQMAQAHLVLGWRRQGSLRLLRSELEASLASDFLDLTREAATELRDRRSLVDPYDPEWDLKEHEYFELAGDEIPGHELFAALDDFLNLGRFDRAQLTKPQFYVVSVQKEDERAFFGRRMANLQVLKKKKNLLAAVWDGDTFNHLEQSVATFSTSFHWVRFRDRLYVLDKTGFHQQFRDLPALQAAVTNHVQTITKKLPIRGADVLVQRCQANISMASKLAHVAERGIWHDDQDTLKDYAERFDLDVTWDDEGLVFDGSLGQEWPILKLLDEDRTEGPVSGRHYESSSKRQVGD